MTMSNPIDLVLSKLPKAKQRAPGQWVSKCPAPSHGKGRGDKSPSLSVNEGGDGQALLHCHAGCEVEDVVHAVGLEMRNLFPSCPPRRATTKKTYDYRDEQGNLLYQVVRSYPKRFQQRRPDGCGGWDWNIGNTRKVLYRLPDLVATSTDVPVFFVEGEKDVETLRANSLVATTISGGVNGKWSSGYTNTLKGRDVVILPDNDPPGRKFAGSLTGHLHGHVRSLKVVDLPELPEKGDVTDWFESRGTKEKLLKLVQECSPWSSATSTVTRTENLPEIDTSNKQLRELTDEAVRALEKANSPARMFKKDGALVRVVPDQPG